MENNEDLELESGKFKLLTEYIKEGVIVVDTEQNVMSINKAAQDLIGYKPSEIIGRPVKDFLYLIDSSDNAIDVNLYCPKGGIDTQGVFFTHKNASLMDREKDIKIVNVYSLKLEKGSRINLGAILVLENVFVQSELERMKIDFVSMAVHVLRTPLTAVRGFLDSLSSETTLTKLTKDEAESIIYAKAGAEELNTLVENLLHLSEIQKGTFTVHPTLIDYENLVGAVVKSMQDRASAKSLQILYTPPLQKFPMIYADISRIKEVLQNLIDNAIKFTEKGGIEVILAQEGGFIHTTIKDTGKGIPEANLKYIFTKFYRIKDPLYMDEGQGLGLFITKNIIDAHKGEIWAESIVDQGSIFHFKLPIK